MDFLGIFRLLFRGFKKYKNKKIAVKNPGTFSQNIPSNQSN